MKAFPFSSTQLSHCYCLRAYCHFYTGPIQIIISLGFVIPQCVQCCLSPRSAEMALLPFLSPLCLRQLFTFVFTFCGRIFFCRCMLATVRLQASSVPLYPTLLTPAFGPKITQAAILSEQTYMVEAVIFSTAWNLIPFPSNHLSDKSVSGLHCADKRQLTCLNAKPHTI